jgi:hypothetical protein
MASLLALHDAGPHKQVRAKTFEDVDHLPSHPNNIPHNGLVDYQRHGASSPEDTRSSHTNIVISSPLWGRRSPLGDGIYPPRNWTEYPGGLPNQLDTAGHSLTYSQKQHLPQSETHKGSRTIFFHFLHQDPKNCRVVNAASFAPR